MIDYIHFDLFGKSGVNKQLQITHPGGTITNKDLYFEQFSLNESISSADVLKFGACEASSMKFRVRNIPGIGSLVGQNLSASLILNHDSANPFMLGSYKGYSDTPTADRKYRDVVAYDALFDVINANVSAWYTALVFPMTLRAFRQSFAEHFGLTEVDADLVNDNITVERTILTNEISGKTILNAICELNGCFGHINREGKLEYVRLKNRQSSDIRKYKAPLKYENYVVAAITRVQVRQEEGDVGGSYGDGENCYIVDGNFIVYGKTQDELIKIAQNLLEEIGGISYRPCSVSTYGNPCIEVGDGLTIHTSDMDIVSIVTSRAFKGIQAMQDTYTSSGKEKQLEQLNSTKDELRKLKSRANVLIRTLEETRSEITKLESYFDEQAAELQQIITEQYTSLVQQSEKIAAAAVDGYTKKTEFEEFKEYAIGELELNSRQLGLRFSEMTENLNTATGELQGQLDKIEEYFVFDVNGLTIGQEDSPFKVVISHEQMQMLIYNNVALLLDPDGNSVIPMLKITKNKNEFGYLTTKDENGRIVESFVGEE